jgi:putative ABC transport system permease protein
VRHPVIMATDDGARGMNALRRDLSFAVRGLVRQPAFAIVAILTLALGVGANASIFSILNALVLRPLPHPAADRLVSLVSSGLEAGTLAEWQAGMRSFEAIGAYAIGSEVSADVRPAMVIRAMPVSADLLGMLGAEPVRGRLFARSDFAPNATPVALVGPGLWAALGGSESFSDRTITYDGVAHTIVGVLPADFAFMRYRDIDVWLPMRPAAGARVSAIGRLTPGATIDRALVEAQSLAERLSPGVAEADRLVRVAGLADIVESDVRSPLYILFGAATLVLLIACVNVANLLLSKATQRSAELAVRSSLGASRLDLVRQLLTENALLALGGGVTGLVLATWTTDLLVRLAPDYTPRIDEIGTDGAVLAFTLAAAVLVTLMAGLVPALRTAGSHGEGSVARRSTDGRATLRGRGVLVAAELALALIVLIASGLLIRTFLVLRPASPGFDTSDRIVARATLPSDDPDRVNDFVDGLRRRLGALAGGSRVAAVTNLPLSGESMLFPVVETEGRPYGAPDRPLMAHFRAATDDYMDVIGMPIVRGRGLSPDDLAGTSRVVVLNENLVRRLWPDEDPVGRRVAFDLPGGPTDFRVVGVSADAAIFGGITGSRPEAFVPLRQSAWARLRLVIHSPGGTLTTDEIRDIAAGIDPAVPLDDFETFDRLAAGSVALPRFQMALMSLFGALACALAVIGCYSVLATAAATRRREIGVRVALGATRRDVVSHIVRAGIPFIFAGLFAGITGAWATTRLLTGVLHGVAPTDPLTFAGAAAALLLTALLAAFLPARRAAAIQPAEVLRSD